MDEHADKFKFPRAFLVLECITKIDLQTKQKSTEMTCHTQIMGGTQAQHDEVKPLLEAINKNDLWKNKDAYRL